MSAEMDRLELSVTAIKTVKDSVVATMTGLAARVRGVAGDAAKATALADELDARAAEFAQAVTDNTVP